MSDGPHRSLPLKKHWKKVAEWAAKPAYSLVEVAGAFSCALEADFDKGLLLKVQATFGRGYLFPEDCDAELEALHREYRGAEAASVLIDCAKEANNSGLIGDAACKVAVENALGTYGRGVCRQIEEHYRRKTACGSVHIRDRLNAIRGHCSPGLLASELLANKTSRNIGYWVPKRAGIDQGPSL